MEYLIACGSNLGDRHGYIAEALKTLSKHGVTILRQSALIESAPVGAADQTFVNGAFVCSSLLAPEDMMTLLLEVESKLGRTREVKWGNRTIDLDIICIRDDKGREVTWNSASLTVPHPRMRERDFVMNPAREIWSFEDAPAWSDGTVVGFLLLGLLIRWIFAALIPFGNDEAYYWDWGRDVQLSYFDHPPMVSWIAWVGQTLLGHSNAEFSGRFLIPLMHFTLSLFLYDLLKSFTGTKLRHVEQAGFLIVSQLVPAFSLGGIMLMPDAGLLLFSTLGVWLLARFLRQDTLTWKDGLFLGLAWGCAGLSKYHAAVIALGALGFVFWTRRTQVSRERAFWLNTILFGLAAITPVVVWNAHHEWASFVFQMSRGVTGEGFRWMPAIRTLVGELAFVGPAFAVALWSGSRRIPNRQLYHLLVFSSVPLFILLKVFSFSSQTLPHWTMPSLWLLAPVAVVGFSASTRLRYSAVCYGLLLCVLIPAALSSAYLRGELLVLLKNRPGGLGELTLWDTASRNDEFTAYLKDRRWTEDLTRAGCSTLEPLIAAPRWFTVAQAASHLPWHPVVQSVDPDKRSYYTYRTDASTWNHCPIVIVSEEAHQKGIEASNQWDILSERKFMIAGHDDRPLIVSRVVRRAP